MTSELPGTAPDDTAPGADADADAEAVTASNRVIVWDNREKAFAVLAGLGVFLQTIRYYAHLPFLGYLTVRPVQYLLFDPATLALIAAGAFARKGSENIVLMVLLGTASLAVDAPLRWFAGRRYGDRVARLLVGGKNAPPPGSKRDRIGQVERFVGRYGTWALVLVWPTPIPSVLVQLAAGSSGMRFRRFIVADLAGTLLWVVIVESIGYALGNTAVRVFKQISHYSLYVTIGVIVLAVVVGTYRGMRQQQAR